MGAIVTVRVVGDTDCYSAFLAAVQAEDIQVVELGSFYYMVTVGRAEPGSGFETLATLMDELAPGSSAGLERAHFG